MFDILVPVLALTIVVVIYAINNPANHSTEFRLRSFINWFPLGLTYALLYMGRYNLTVAKNALADLNLMSNSDFGTIFGIGAVVYGLSFTVNGPLTDKIGGKRSILIGAFGAAAVNLVMGWMLYLIITGQSSFDLATTFTVLYALNMYFQSFGAVSIVKVNASWFHIRERGVFGALFGVLISLGLEFAFDWNSTIIKAVSPDESQLGVLEHLLRALFGAEGTTVVQTWWVFFVPAILLVVFAIFEIFVLKDRPSQAGLKDFETGDASSGEMDRNFTVLQLYKKILTNPIIITIALIEFCSGVLRNGIMHWGTIYAKTFGFHTTDFIFSNWGKALMIAGITGGFFAGLVSDKLFQSRRAPSACLLYGGMAVAVGVMVFTLDTYAVLGYLAIFISMCVIGVHGMLSGTATMDFGGRKGAGTAVGVIDGFVYLGTGFQSLALGYLLPNDPATATWQSWSWWPVFLLPFTLIGLALTLKIWKAFPDQKRGGGH